MRVVVADETIIKKYKEQLMVKNKQIEQFQVPPPFNISQVATFWSLFFSFSTFSPFLLLLGYFLDCFFSTFRPFCAF